MIRLGPQQRPRCRDAIDGDLGQWDRRVPESEILLIERRIDRDIGLGGSEVGRSSQTRRGRRQHPGDALRVGLAKVLVLRVVLDEQIADAEEASDRSDRCRVSDMVLHRLIERIKHVGGGHRSHHLLLVDEEGSCQRGRLWAVDSVAPAE